MAMGVWPMGGTVGSGRVVGTGMWARRQEL